MVFDPSRVDLGSLSQVSESEELDDAVEDNLDFTMSEATKVNPDQHAKNLNLSRQSGVPTFAVQDNPDVIEQEVKTNQFDFSGLRDTNPKTAQHFNNIDNAIVAQDDVDIMKSIEDIFSFNKTFDNIGKSISLGFDKQGKGALLAGVDMTPTRREDLIPMSAMPIGMEMDAQMLSLDFAERMDIKSDEELQKVKAESVDELINNIRTINEERGELTADDLNLLEQGVRAGIESLANMAPGSALMLASGGRAFPLLMTIGAQTYSDSYGEGRAEGLTPEQSQWFAGIDAFIEVGTEILPTGTLETILTGKSTGLKKDALKFVIREMGTEQLATLGQSLNSYLFGLDEQMESAATIEDKVNIQLQRQAVTAIATVVAGGAQITAATTVRRGIDALTADTLEKETQGEVEQRQIDELNEKSTDSKLRERDKESFKQFVEEADGENTNVFIDSAQAALYMQDKTQDEIEADPALTILSEQVAEASETGADIQVPVADFAADFAGTDHFTELRDSMTMSAETVAPFRQEQVRQETENYVNKLMEEAQQNTSEYVQAQEIYTQVRDQLIDTGQVNDANASIMAQVVPAWATAQAARTGKTVEQVYRDSGLVIEGPQTGERARVEGEMVLEQAPEELENLNNLWDQYDDTGDITHLDLVDEVEAFIEDSESEFTDLSKAVSDYRQEQREDVELGGRGDMDTAENNFNDVLLATVEQRATLLEQAKVTEDEKIRRQAERDAREEITPEAVTAQQEIINEAKTRTDKQALAEFNRAKAGESVTFNHRSPFDFETFDDAHLDDIVETRTPSTHLGHYLSADDVGNAGRHGDVTSVYEFKLENPLIISAEAFESATDGLTHEEAIAKRQLFMELGHDGILVEGLNWVIVFESATATKLEEDVSVLDETVFKQEQVDDLLGGNIDESGKYTDTEGDVQPTPIVRDQATITGRETIKKVDVGFEELDTADKIARATISLSKSPQEKLWAITLDKNNKPLAILNHTMGLKDSASVDPAAVAGWAVSVPDATQVWFSHNHPAGDAKLSNSDVAISKRIANLLDGSSVESKGIMAVTDLEFKHEDMNVSSPSELIPESDTVNQIDLVERTLEKVPPRDAKRIESPKDAKSIIENLSAGDEGVLLLNNKHTPVGFLPFDFEKHGGELRGGELSTLLKAVESTNASAVMLNTNKLDSNERNVANMLAAADMRVLDAFVNGVSASERGWQISTGTTFKQKGKVEARGYYDPANSIIRLTEAANLSTFLHEFAHFMYEMEVNGDTEMLQSINSWYKRNADEVAKEANGYLGDEFDELKQQQIEESASTETEEFKTWFGDSKVVDENGEPLVVYHATGEKFEKFVIGEIGFHFSEDSKLSTKASEMAGNRGDVLLPVYLSAENLIEIPDQNGRFSYEHVIESLLDKKIITEEQFNQASVEYEDYLDDPTNQDLKAERDFEKNKVFTDFENVDRHAEFLLLKPFLKEWGIDGFKYWNEYDAYGEAIRFRNLPGVQEELDALPEQPGWSYIVFNSEQIKSVEAEKFDPTDPSIFAQDPTTPTPTEGSITADDVITFLDNTTTGDKAKDAAIRRAVHEQFARGFEAYLMEGKAPSIELRNAFRTFARWLARIYQSMRGQLNVNLDDEIRAVFDRLVATEDQIAAAEARAQVEPMFTDAAMAGMTEKEFADYQQRQQKVKDIQSETLRDKLIKQLTRQTQKWWTEEKNDIIDEETESLKKERVHAAREVLKSKELKIDHATVKELYGEQKTDKIGRKSVVIPPALIGMTAKGQQGVHPDEAAAFLGYTSGAEMIDDILTAPSLKAAAAANAETRMIERHGDIFTDGTIEREADEAVMNEERGKLILAELKTLAKGTNAPIIDRATIKDLAATNIGKLSFREIHPGKYRKAEIRAAQEAAAMLATGNREGAAAAKMRQVMNYYLGMEATAAKNETLKIVDRMGRYTKKKVREQIVKAENGYWDQIVKILNRFEFRKAATLQEVENINLWAKERTEADGDGLVLSNAVLNESYVTHWKNVPFSDLQGVNDSVKNIEHVARYANKIKLQQEEIDFKKLKSDWVDSINEQDARFPTKASRSRIDDARKATVMEHVRRWASQLTKVPYLASWLDGGERTGLSQDILVQQFTDALDVKMKMVDEVATPVMEAINNRSKEDQKRHNTKIWIPEIEDNLMGHQVLAVALNTGNQGNLKKMLLGEAWANPDVDAEISFENPKLQAVLNHMTKNDWVLVQKIWDQMEILYPQLAEVHRKTTGLVPPKVVATPIVTEFGTFKGGYYPVKYSPKRSHKAEKNAEKREAETESMFNNTASIQSSVNTGATNERTGFYDRVNLSLEVVPDHFNETIHYITHHDAVRQVNRLIQAPEIADAISSVLGEAEFKQLKPWLNDIAKDGRQQPVKTYIDEAFQRLRFGTTLGVMGFKASTGIMQVYGLFTTAADLGVKSTVKGIQTTIGRSWYMKAVRSVLGSVDDMQTGWEFAAEKSKVMNHRTATMDREIRNAMDRLRGKTGFMAAVQETSMKHIMLIQTYMVDLPTWHAAYTKELSESGDEARAIKRADWSVENLQGSGATKDMATILRSQSKIHSTFTMFMTFFSSLGNLSRDVIKGKQSGLYSNSSVAAKMMFLFTLPVFFEMLMRGELDEPEDEDERLNKFLVLTALYPLTSIPFIRDVASGIIGDYGYNSSPVASVLEKGISGFKQIGERAFTDEEITKGAVKNASKLTGVMLTVPGVSQIWSTGEHLYDVIEEGEELTVRELLFGPKRE